MLYPNELRAHGRSKTGRGREIRTPDILLPKQARYQTALYPVFQLLRTARRSGIIRSVRPRVNGDVLILVQFFVDINDQLSIILHSL